MMRRFLILSLILSVIIIVGCDSDESNVTNDPEDIDDEVSTANNEFGFKLFQSILADEADQTFLSPTSAYIALSMLYNGADEITKDEIADVLQLSDNDIDTLNETNATLINVLERNSDDITLNIANSLWLNEQFSFQESFASAMDEYYTALTETIDIEDSMSIERINAWVDEATNGKITEMFDLLPDNLITIIMNAIYLDANWTIPFDKNLTEERPFHLADGTEQETPFMQLNEEIPYMENDEIQATKLTYGEDESMAMTIILPAEDISTNDFLNELTIEQWNKLQKDLSMEEGTLLLPRFDIEYEVQLNDYLIDLGMPSAFNEDANLSKLIEDHVGLYVSEVKQKSMINVNEEGTEAAAATSIAIVEMSANVDHEPFYMEVNRPFYIGITDEATGTILFLGYINHPE